MSARRPARQPAGTAPAGFDALEFGRLTWIGLVVAALGWALLLGETAVADILPAHGVRGPLHGDLLDIAKCVIASGFALALIGALQNGFGTLNRFFEAVLTRSSQRGVDGARPVATPVAAAQPLRARRPYRTLDDGSVEVETILGTRRFATMHEAAEFI